MMQNEYWVSAYTQFGQPFFTTVVAGSTDEMLAKFRAENPDAEVADYDKYEPLEDEYEEV